MIIALNLWVDVASEKVSSEMADFQRLAKTPRREDIIASPQLSPVASPDLVPKAVRELKITEIETETEGRRIGSPCADGAQPFALSFGYGGEAGSLHLYRAADLAQLSCIGSWLIPLERGNTHSSIHHRHLASCSLVFGQSKAAVVCDRHWARRTAPWTHHRLAIACFYGTFCP